MHSEHLSLSLSLILPLLALITFVSPHAATSFHPREVDSSSDPPIAGIFTTFTSSNGTDVTSDFQPLFYDGNTPSNLVERQVPGVTRPIISCRRSSAAFIYSECNYHAGFRHSIQRYRIRCSLSRSQSFIFEEGHCNADEICVNGHKDAQGNPTVASCVGQKLFEMIPNYNSPAGKEWLQQTLKDKRARAVISQKDRQTALYVESLEIEAGVAGAGRVGGQVGLTGQDKCSDCANVAIEKLEQGTDFLSTEVTVSAAGAAAAGILWLAVLSG